ncbi:hypothetical protein L596_004564 [Steinernema carpocapsae]|uniref:DNA-directed primase/polymerase protein n=1 Tax=Steinernema carpocapsae TaxID=34508 RepID=A0A4U8UW59_STECR|nr:hypothetical protein L596_004564 [Steinernema carpocapsae]
MDCRLQEALLNGTGEVFAKQRDAISCWKSEPHKRIFCFEASESGSRAYLVSTLNDFWSWYEKAESRHFYEVLPEDVPCRLYFDLEYYRSNNRKHSDALILDEFCSSCAEFTNEKLILPETLSVEKDFFILDSSNEDKFSSHVIVHLPGGSLFRSNICMKAFVEELSRRLLESDRAVVLNANSERVPLCDMAVYSKNRCFRLYLSSKAGKCTSLKIHAASKFYGADSPNPRQVFADSLVIPEDYESQRIVLFKQLTTGSRSQSSYLFADTNLCWGSNDSVSPFPMTEDYILEINKKFKSLARIRSWRIVRESNSIGPQVFYQLIGTRYCFNIGREHRSNHIYWIVNIQKSCCYQKCFDPDCGGFRSYQFPLPYFSRKELSENGRYYETEEQIQQPVSKENLIGIETRDCDSSFYDLASDKLLFLPSSSEYCEDSFYDPSTDRILTS